MSKYTTQLRWPIENHLDSLGLEHSETNWPKCFKLLGLDDYPIFDRGYRKGLNSKIIRAYYFREIGFETFGQFSWQMRRMMHEIMPYYNQLYESEKIITDPLLTRNMSYVEEWSRDETVGSENASTSQGKSKTDSRNVFQDTPMNGLDTGAVQTMGYATSVTLDSTGAESYGANQGRTSRVGDYDGTSKHLEKGLDGSQSQELLTYRKTFLNIDLMIVGELDELFMGLW